MWMCALVRFFLSIPCSFLALSSSPSSSSCSWYVTSQSSQTDHVIYSLLVNFSPEFHTSHVPWSLTFIFIHSFTLQWTAFSHAVASDASSAHQSRRKEGEEDAAREDAEAGSE